MKGIVAEMEVVMHNITKQIIVGVAIAVISASALGVKSIYDDVQANTKYRMESLELASRIEENHQILVRLEANQKFLLR